MANCPASRGFLSTPCLRSPKLRRSTSCSRPVRRWPAGRRRALRPEPVGSPVREATNGRVVASRGGDRRRAGDRPGHRPGARGPRLSAGRELPLRRRCGRGDLRDAENRGCAARPCRSGPMSPISAEGRRLLEESVALAGTARPLGQQCRDRPGTAARPPRDHARELGSRARSRTCAGPSSSSQAVARTMIQMQSERNRRPSRRSSSSPRSRAASPASRAASIAWPRRG